MKLDRKGFTKFELTAVIIMIAIVIAIAIPVWLHFVETERRAMDRLESINAETEAHTEYMLSHWQSGEAVMYMFTGNNELCQILRHAPYNGGNDFSLISMPVEDKYSDGGNNGSGLEAKARSKKLEEISLIIVIDKNGEVVYNSWKERLAKKY